jgi:hypothetical protein
MYGFPDEMKGHNEVFIQSFYFYPRVIDDQKSIGKSFTRPSL